MDPKTGIIFDVKKYSINDGPGIRTTVFFKGCPLQCWWCHNPESQSIKPELMIRENRCIACGGCQVACQNNAVYWEDGISQTDRTKCLVCGQCAQNCFSGARETLGRNVSVAELMAQIERDIPFYEQSGGGVTFSGGEPLMQPGFLLGLLQACREQEIHTVLDTSGFARWELIDSLRGLVDLFLYDLKLMDSARHQHFTGVKNELILENLRNLSQLGEKLMVRIPVIPGINDDQVNLESSAKFLASLPHLETIELMPYHDTGIGKYKSLGKSYLLEHVAPPSEDQIQMIAQQLRAYHLDVIEKK